MLSAIAQDASSLRHCDGRGLSRGKLARRVGDGAGAAEHLGRMLTALAELVRM